MNLVPLSHVLVGKSMFTAVSFAFLMRRDGNLDLLRRLTSSNQGPKKVLE